MASHDDLQDYINVSVKAERANFPKSVYAGIFSRAEKTVNWKLNNAKTQIASNVGSELALLNQKSQKAGIMALNAISEGNLFGSISIKGGRGSQTVHYKVGTNLRRYYPHWVVYSRPPATAHNVAMKFKPKDSNEYIFRHHVKKAEARNYPAVAHALFEPNIKSVVEREVQRVLRR